MCEPACIKYKSGSTFSCSNPQEAKAVAKRTYENAVSLFAYLCKLYGLNPLASGVILSHSEGHTRGIASNHGDPEHLWKQLGTGYTMDTFRKAVKAAMSGNYSSNTTTPPKAEKALYRVQVGAYSQKSNADAMAAKLKKAGFDAIIVKV